MASVTKRGNSYKICASCGYNVAGEQIRQFTTWTPEPNMTEKQIEKELERQKVLFDEKCKNGAYMDSNIKFEAFAELWFKDYAQGQLRERTIDRYRQLTKRTYQAIGHLRIDRIQPHHLLEFYSNLGENNIKQGEHYTSKVDLKALAKEKEVSYTEFAELSNLGRRTVITAFNGNSVSSQTAHKIADAFESTVSKLFKKTADSSKKLAPKTIKHYHTFISSVMERAVKWGLIDVNPCHRIDPPKAGKHELDYLSDKEAIQFLDYLQDEPIEYQVMFNILLLTGMRRGELMGLEWNDIDFKNKTISIMRTSQYTPSKGIFTDTTKTEQSKRLVSIPVQIIAMLNKYKLWQGKQRLSLGDQWINTNRLFTQWNGEPMHPNTPYQYFQKLLKKYSMRKVSLHSLRHTNATLMINSGTDIRTVSGRLGHSQTSTTLNIYAHELRSANEAASDAISNILYKQA